MGRVDPLHQVVRRGHQLLTATLRQPSVRLTQRNSVRCLPVAIREDTLTVIMLSYFRPSNGGKFCIGERKRFRICNTDECPPETPTFRQRQCSEFDFVPYKNAVYEWEPVPIQSEWSDPGQPSPQPRTHRPKSGLNDASLGLNCRNAMSAALQAQKPVLQRDAQGHGDRRNSVQTRQARHVHQWQMRGGCLNLPTLSQ